MKKLQKTKEYSPIIVLLTGIITLVLATPKSTLDGKIDSVNHAAIGELVILDAGVSDAESYVWEVLPSTSNFKIIDGGKQLVFSATTEGEYLFICAMCRGNSIQIVIKKVIVGESSSLRIKDWLPNNYNKKDARRLADSFRLVVESKPTTVEELLNRTKISTNAALNDDLGAWKSFLDAVSDYCQKNMVDKSLEDHLNLWMEISVELKKV